MNFIPASLMLERDRGPRAKSSANAPSLRLFPRRNQPLSAFAMHFVAWCCKKETAASWRGRRITFRKRAVETPRVSRRSRCPFRPIEPLLEPIVAPKDLAVVGCEAGRSWKSQSLGGRTFHLEPVLDAALIGERERRLGIGADGLQQSRHHIPIRDGLASAELGAIDRFRERRARLALQRRRDSRREQAALRKRLRMFERQIQRIADAPHVAPHVAALDGVDVERRIPPAKVSEYGPEQERAPDDRDAPVGGEGLDAHPRGGGIGARELVPKIGAGHCALPTLPNLAQPTSRAKALPARERRGA